MLKKIFFQTHWLLGITLGIVLSVVGVTGAMLSFEHEILHLLNPGMSITPQPQPLLTPAELAARVKATAPDRTILSVTVASDPTEPAKVQLAPRPGEGGRGETRVLNPFTGEQLAGPPAGQAFFRLTMQIHRWLAGGAFGAQDIGKQIVALSTVACLIFCVTGLYLRWPRKPLDWRAWLALDLRRKGRALLWHLHIVVGTWVLVPYIVMSLTGLTWSYEWWRNALTDLAGAPRPQQMQMGGPGGQPAGGRQGGGGAGPSIDLDAAWGAFRGQVKEFEVATVRLPDRPGRPVQVQYRDIDPPHERAGNTLTLDPATWAVTGHRRYADLPLGQRLVASFFPLHSGSYFGTVGLIVFMLSSLAMPFFAVTGWIFYLARRKRKKAKAEAEAAATGSVAA
jgi:sulfite reductase (NADPH) flavoprotein alpha-component